MAYITPPLFVRDKQNPFLSLARAASSTRSSSSSPPPTTVTTMDSPSSDVPRSSLLGSIAFLNRSSRPRNNNSNSNNNSSNNNNSNNNHTPIAEQPPPFPAITTPLPPPAAITLSASGNPRRRTVQPGVSSNPSASNPLGYMLRRRRSANNVGERNDRDRRETTSNSSQRERGDRGDPSQSQGQPVPPASQQQQQQQSQGAGPTHRIRLVPHLDNMRSLHFEAICRDVRQGDAPLRIGRFTEQPGATSNKLAFKSKVVSRGHAEVWFDNGIFYIKDTKSSSGTFLNHIRLSSPNTESRPFAIKDGDVLQLGVDYQGGTEEIYRCVKMRVELGREWQNGVNAFNSHALAQLKSLASPNLSSLHSQLPKSKSSKSKSSKPKFGSKSKSKSKSKSPSANGSALTQGVSVPDCCICLSTVTVCQALFIAPCSHVYHYKCIRPLLMMHHPGFSCPLCRTFADLEADVEEVPGGEEGEEEESEEESEEEEDGGQEGQEGDGLIREREREQEDVDVEMRDESAEAEVVSMGEELEYVSVGGSANHARLSDHSHPSLGTTNPSVPAVAGGSNSLSNSNNDSRGSVSNQSLSNSLNLSAASPTPTHIALGSGPTPVSTLRSMPSLNAPLPALPFETTIRPLVLPRPVSATTAAAATTIATTPTPLAQDQHAHTLPRSRSLVEMQGGQQTDAEVDAEPDPGNGTFVPWVMIPRGVAPVAPGAALSHFGREGEGEGEMMEGATFLGGVPPPGFGSGLGRVMQEEEEQGSGMGVGEEGAGAGKRRRVEDGVL